MTELIYDMYQKKTLLEQNNLTDSIEYKSIIFNLPLYTEVESFNKIDVEKTSLEVKKLKLKERKKHNLFPELSKEILIKMRALNEKDEMNYHTLIGMFPRIVSDIEEEIERNLLVELQKNIEIKGYSKKNTDYFIKFKNSLIFMNKNFERELQFLGNNPLNMEIKTFTKEECNMIIPAINQLINIVLENISNVDDDSIEPHDLVSIMYLKSCIRVLPKEYMTTYIMQIETFLDEISYIAYTTNRDFSIIPFTLETALNELLENLKQK